MNPDFLLDLGDYHAPIVWSGIKDFQKRVHRHRTLHGRQATCRKTG